MIEEEKDEEKDEEKEKVEEAYVSLCNVSSCMY